MFSRRLFGASFLIGGPYRFIKSSVRRCLGGSYELSKPYYGVEVFQSSSISVPVNSRALAGMEASRSGTGYRGNGEVVNVGVRTPFVPSLSFVRPEEPRAEIESIGEVPMRVKKRNFIHSRPAAVSSCGGLRGGAAKWHK